MKQIIFIFLFLFSFVSSGAREYKLNKPKYAKLILSKDKKKVLTIAFDTTDKQNKDYKILYVSKKLDGSFDTRNLEKYPANVKYKYHIFNVAQFQAIKLPPIYDKHAEHETKIWISHWANQKKIWAKKDDERKRSARRGGYVSWTDPTPQGEFYVSVKYKIRQGPTRWDYIIRRCIKTSDDLERAPVTDFTEKPSLKLDIVNGKRSKSKKGIVVSLVYAGSDSVLENSSSFIDNYVSWTWGTLPPEANIVIKKQSGERIDKFTKKLRDLEYRDTRGMDRKRAAKTERAEFMTRIPDGGAIIEVEVDAGPMFGKLTAKQSIDL